MQKMPEFPSSPTVLGRALKMRRGCLPSPARDPRQLLRRDGVQLRHHLVAPLQRAGGKLDPKWVAFRTADKRIRV